MRETEILLRAATPSDRPALLSLLRAAMGPASDAHRDSFFTWKHEENPFGPSAVWLAETGGEVVAIRAFLRWRLRSGGASVDVVRAVDTATHAEFRGRGLFRRLTLKAVDELRRQGVAFVFNTPNQQSRPGYLSMGWRRVARVPAWIRPLRPLAGLGALLRGHRAPPEDVPPSADELVDPRDEVGLRALLDDPRASSLWDRPAEPRWHTPRDARYLAWRYTTIPTRTYGAVADLAGEHPAAIVYRMRRRLRCTELDVAELLCDPRRPLSTRPLLRRLLRSAARRGAHYVVACAAPGTPQSRLLSRAGFIPLPALGPWLVWRPLAWPTVAETKLQAPERWARWRLEWGDLELF